MPPSSMTLQSNETQTTLATAAATTTATATKTKAPVCNCNHVFFVYFIFKHGCYRNIQNKDKDDDDEVY